MNKFLLAAGIMVATPLAAQTMPMPAPAPGAQRPAMHGEKGDRVQARAEVVARTQRMFAMLDVNHDNVLDQTEIAAAGKGREGGPEAATDATARRMPLDRNAMFDMIDTNHDGVISRDEFARAPGQGMQWRAGGTAGGGGGMGGGMARMWTMADADHDGRITLQEATDLALQHFDRMDLNHDGQLTPEERAAGRAQMEQMRGQ